MDAIPNPSKEQLVDVVQRHFMSQVLVKLVAVSFDPFVSCFFYFLIFELCKVKSEQKAGPEHKVLGSVSLKLGYQSLKNLLICRFSRTFANNYAFSM